MNRVNGGERAASHNFARCEIAPHGCDDALEIALHQPPLNQRMRAISRHKLELIAWERIRQRERLPARSLER